MRPLHLLGLMPPEYRFYSPDSAPLMLPGAIPGGDHEVILAFFQQVITEQPLPRVEVDWHTMLLEPSRLYLEHLLGERGSSGVLLVVKVRQRGVDLHEVAAHPAIRAFQHVAISNVHPGGPEDLRALLALTKDVRERAEDRYEELAHRIELLQPDGWRLIAEFVRTLQNPIDVLETANALIEVQLEKNPPEEQQKRLLRRILIRLLEWRPAGELCALVGLATRGAKATAKLLKKDAEIVMEGLRAQGLFRDGELRQWAAYLGRGELREGLFGPEAKLPTEAQLTEAWAKRVRTAMGWAGTSRSLKGAKPLLVADEAILQELESIVQSVNEGKLSRAREILTALERGLAGRPLGSELLPPYWHYRAAVEFGEGLLDGAEFSSREALRYAESAGLSAVDRGGILDGLGRTLRDQGKLDEAETTLREALQLKQEGGATATSRGTTLHGLGLTLRDQGKLDEAETTLREALQLKQEGGDSATSRGIILHELGRTLRDQGKLDEAETTLREALQLMQEGGATATINRSITPDKADKKS